MNLEAPAPEFELSNSAEMNLADPELKSGVLTDLACLAFAWSKVTAMFAYGWNAQGVSKLGYWSKARESLTGLMAQGIYRGVD